MTGVAGTDAAPSLIGPFKSGQRWSVSSDSKTDPKIPPTTVFTVFKVESARHTVIGIPVGGSDKTPIQIEYPANDPSFLLADISPVAAGASKIRTCMFPQAAESSFQGTAVHFNPSQLKADPEAFRADYLTSHPTASDQEAIQAFLKSVAPDDTGPCTLTLLN